MGSLLSLNRLEKPTVRVLLTGRRPRPAQRAAGIAFEERPLEYCISSGLAGGLRPEHSILQERLARIAPKALTDSNGDPKVTFRVIQICLSHSPAECGRHCGRPVSDSADHVVGRPDEKKHLGKVADAVEMESFEILAAATAAGVPAAAIRAISDTSDEPLPLDMNEVFSDEGAVSIPRVIGQVAKHPSRVGGLLRPGETRAAREGSRVIGAGCWIRYIVSRNKPAPSRSKTRRPLLCRFEQRCERQLLRLEQANAEISNRKSGIRIEVK